MKIPVIEFKDYSFKYHSQSDYTLHDINLTIYKGEKILIIGPSGSGKSTLGNCINGLIPNSYKGDVKGDLIIVGKNTVKMLLVSLNQWFIYHIGVNTVTKLNPFNPR